MYGKDLLTFTLPETDIAPENGRLEYYFPVGMAYFQVICRWFQIFVVFTPIPGEMIQFDSYFQVGSNHQLVYYLDLFKVIFYFVPG